MGQKRSPYPIYHAPGGPKAGPYTQGLVALLVLTSLGVSLADRSGMGLLQQMVFNRDSIWHGEVWRLATYPWLKTSPLALMLSAVVLYLFCGPHERMWGGPKMLRFVLTSLLGAGVLALFLAPLLAFLMPFADSPWAAGPDAAIDALLMATALQAPQSSMLFGFVLPIQARTFVWLMVGFEIVGGIMNQVSQLSLTLGGLMMGYLLVNDVLHPRALYEHVRELMGRPKRRRHLHVVPPAKKDRTWN